MPHQFDYPYKNFKEVFVPALVKWFQVLFDVWQLHQIHDGLGRVDNFLLEADSIHVQKAGKHAVGDQLFVAHDFRTVEGRYNLHKQFAGALEITHDQAIDPLIHFKLVFALPVTPLLQQLVALVDIFFDFVVKVLLQIDGDQFEGDVHFLADLDCLFEGQVVGDDCLVQLLVVMVEFGLGKQCVSYLSLAEILFCVFDFQVLLCEKLIESLLNIHIQIIFKLSILSSREIQVWNYNWGLRNQLDCGKSYSLL